MTITKTRHQKAPDSRFPNYSVNITNPADLSQLELKKIVDDLGKQLPNLKIKTYFNVKPELLKSSDHLVLSRNSDNEIIGALASKWYTNNQLTFLHIMTMFIAENYQGTALFSRMWMAHLTDLSNSFFGFPFVFALKTYNPISFSLLRQIARSSQAEFYPKLDDTVPEWMQAQVETISKILEPYSKFNVATGAITGGGGSVPNNFYPSLPKSCKNGLNSYFQAHLTPKDRLLCCLFCIDKSSQQRLFDRFAGITERSNS